MFQAFPFSYKLVFFVCFKLFLSDIVSTKSKFLKISRTNSVCLMVGSMFSFISFPNSHTTYIIYYILYTYIEQTLELRLLI